MKPKHRKKIIQLIDKIQEQNLIKLYISNNSKETEQICENNRNYLYVEFINTYPIISYLFNTDKPLVIGRNSDKCNIVINNNMVSRCQCEIYVSGYQVILRDVGGNNSVFYKTALRKKQLEKNSSILIFNTDILLIGKIKIRIFLVNRNADLLN